MECCWLRLLLGLAAVVVGVVALLGGRVGGVVVGVVCCWRGVLLGWWCFVCVNWGFVVVVGCV